MDSGFRRNDKELPVESLKLDFRQNALFTPSSQSVALSRIFHNLLI